MKTKEYIARDYVISNHPHYAGTARGNELVTAFLAGMEEAGRWISVEDELPEVDTLVFVKVQNSRIAVGCVNRNGVWFDNIGTAACIHNVSHWRPINRK